MLFLLIFLWVFVSIVFFFLSVIVCFCINGSKNNEERIEFFYEDFILFVLDLQMNSTQLHFLFVLEDYLLVHEYVFFYFLVQTEI